MQRPIFRTNDKIAAIKCQSQGDFMHADSAPRQTFGKNSSRGFAGRITLTGQGLVLGAGTVLAKLDDKTLSVEAEQERIWALLSVAYGEEVPHAVLGSLRRVAKHWQSGDKCLAAIHLAHMGLPDIGEDAAYRLALAAELIDAGIAPRELAQELGLSPVQFDVSKYDENQPRVPAGSGRESGQWTSSGDAASGDAAGSPLIEGRSAAGANSGKVNVVRDLPKDAIVVTRPDGTTIDDPKFPTRNSWLRHGQISRRSMRLENKYPTNRRGSSFFQQKPRLSNLERMIFSGIKQRTLRSLNMLTPPITPSASIWLARVTENGSRSRLLKHMAISDHQFDMTLKDENGRRKAGKMLTEAIGKSNEAAVQVDHRRRRCNRPDHGDAGDPSACRFVRDSLELR
jgi:hypothetical protein